MHRSVLPILICGLALVAEKAKTDELVNLIHQDCGSCHGITLKGGLGPDIRPEALKHYDIDSLSMLVLEGIPETAMPPWRELISEAEARRIASYLLKGEEK